MSGLSWTVLVPVKRLLAAKTRLRGAVPDVPHEQLVLALARDTVLATLRCPAVGRVVVVTNDPTAQAATAALGAVVLPDAPDAGLNQALAYGATTVRSRLNGSDTPGVAAIAADLPALRPDDLSAALRAAAELATVPARAARRAFVTDTAGTGTVLLAAPPGVPLQPSFGAGSAAAPAAGGAVAVEGPLVSLRRDVDTAGDLAEAAALGVGPHTSALLTGVGYRVDDRTASFDRS
ncbi:2-phospho-L-lactate guanylyltransferase [Luedemannella helvata]|uniref:Phosphoenolpyruvate guanylyltransferase n=1 Tax=Luedemannella helvata TaxID=349315 RepID=A0ABP4XB66_9ACTN